MCSPILPYQNFLSCIKTILTNESCFIEIPVLEAAAPVKEDKVVAIKGGKKTGSSSTVKTASVATKMITHEQFEGVQTKTKSPKGFHVSPGYKIADSNDIFTLFCMAIKEAYIAEAMSTPPSTELESDTTESDADKIAEKMDENLEVICNRQQKLINTKSEVPENLSLRCDAAVIAKKEGATDVNAADLSLSGSSTESSVSEKSTQIRKAGLAVITAYTHNKEDLQEKVNEYKSLLTNDWKSKTEKSQKRLNNIKKNLDDSTFENIQTKISQVMKLAEKLIERHAEINATVLIDIDKILNQKIGEIENLIKEQNAAIEEKKLAEMAVAKRAKELELFKERSEVFNNFCNTVCKSAGIKVPAASSSMGDTKDDVVVTGGASTHPLESAILATSSKCDAEGLEKIAAASSTLEGSLSVEGFLKLPGIQKKVVNESSIETPYEKRVGAWFWDPLSRLKGSHEENTYSGSVDELYIQELLHSVPIFADLLVNTCFSTFDEHVPTKMSRVTKAFPGAIISCRYEISNPWADESSLIPSLMRARSLEDSENNEIEDIATRHIHAALKHATGAEVSKETIFERRGVFEIAFNPVTKSWYHRYINRNNRTFPKDFSHVNTSNYQQSRAYIHLEITQGEMHVADFNIYKPNDARTHVGLLEFVVTDPSRGFTVRFYKEF